MGRAGKGGGIGGGRSGGCGLLAILRRRPSLGGRAGCPRGGRAGGDVLSRDAAGAGGGGLGASGREERG